MKLVPLILIMSILFAGCSSIVPGNFVNSRLTHALPDKNNICLNSAYSTPSALNTNEILKAELIKQGFSISCEAPYVLASWAYEIGNQQTEIHTTQGIGSSSGAMSCAGSVCSGTSSSSYLPGHTSTSVTYGREFLLSVYEASSLPENPKVLWSIQLTSRGSTTQLNKLMKMWAPIIASNWGQNVSNEFVPNSGMSIILD